MVWVSLGRATACPAAKVDKDMMRRLIGLFAAAAVLALLATAASSVQRVQPWAQQPWERWQAHDPTSWRRIDHGRWEQFLLRYVRIGPDGIHRVAYGAVTPGDFAVLERYIAHLASLPLENYNRDEQMAYWINLHNALIVRLVVEHYPIAEIRDVPGVEDPFARDLVTIDGEGVSLNDIRHRILRPISDDPRIHYALTCAAVGCPDLQPEPFEGHRVDEQLTEVAMAYINDPRCIRVDGERLAVSQLFRWYKEDFGGTDRAVINHLMAYAEPRLAMRLQRFDRISHHMFNWALNDATG